MLTMKTSCIGHFLLLELKFVSRDRAYKRTSLNKTDAFRTGVSGKRTGFFCKYSHKFSSNLSISFVQIISVLDKSRALVSCVRVDYVNKTQMLLNPSIQFLRDAWRLLLKGRKGMHYAQLTFTLP